MVAHRYTHVRGVASMGQSSVATKWLIDENEDLRIETMRAQAETQMLKQMADQLTLLKKNGSGTIANYVRNVKLSLFGQVKRVILEAKK